MNEQTTIIGDESVDVIPQNLAIEAMRDSGYRNSAAAISELVDNSIEAHGRTVHIICEEQNKLVAQRSTWKMCRIAVCDDGDGMDAATLRKALQFGNGTRLTSRAGIGRFGMGLPNSSISQADRVDVWSWQNGPDNAMHAYLDVSEVKSRKQREVPVPKGDAVPKEWRVHLGPLGKAGTLVVWSRLDPDRMTVKKASKALESVEHEIGRVHRHFISAGDLVVHLMSVRDGEIVDAREARINDPLYLTAAPHLPEPFCNEPMFSKALDDQEFIVEIDGKRHKITTRYSVARPETWDFAGGKSRGDTAYGKDAAKNVGVSLVRAGRELILDRSWTITYDPTERWWGCEVHFPPELDEIFGVTNNKQDATFFRQLSSLEWIDFAEDGETETDVRTRLADEEDPRAHLLKLSEEIKKNLGQIREILRAQGSNRRGGKRADGRHSGPSPTDEANQRWRERDATHPFPQGDEAPSKEDIKGIREDLEDAGHSEAEREGIVARIQSGELKIVFVDKDLGSSANLFFIQPRGGTTEVVLNRRHPAFDSIFDTVSVEEKPEEMGTAELQRRLEKAYLATHVLFAAWARMEREDAQNETRYERVRETWGMFARDFLEERREGAGGDL